MRSIYTDYMYTKLRFGKYRGYFLKDVPDDYVIWATRTLTDQAQATMFGVELQRRHAKLRS